MTTKIKILHLRDSPWVCGPGRTILESATSIDKERYDYIVGAFAGHDGNQSALIDACRSRGLSVFPIRERSSFDLRMIIEIIRYIREHDVKILHTHEFRSDVIGLIAARLCRIILVSTSHGWISNSKKDRLFVRIDKYILRFYDQILVVSEKIRNELIKHKVRSEKISVIHNALVLENFNSDKSDRSFREINGIDEKTFLIGKIGRLSPEKGHMDLIRAVETLSTDNVRFKIILAGIGPLEANLKAEIEKRGLSVYFLFVGYVSYMISLYNSLDLVVQSSYTEGMPNVILESLLMEIPVIATDVGGTGEIVKDGHSGCLIKPGDPLVLARFLREFFSDIDRYKTMARNGRATILENFNFAKRTKKLEALYENILQNHKR